MISIFTNSSDNFTYVYFIVWLFDVFNFIVICYFNFINFIKVFVKFFGRFLLIFNLLLNYSPIRVWSYIGILSYIITWEFCVFFVLFFNSGTNWWFENLTRSTHKCIINAYVIAIHLFEEPLRLWPVTIIKVLLFTWSYVYGLSIWYSLQWTILHNSDISRWSWWFNLLNSSRIHSLRYTKIDV